MTRKRKIKMSQMESLRLQESSNKVEGTTGGPQVILAKLDNKTPTMPGFGPLIFNRILFLL
jgi:hypothetical protein